MGRPESIIMRKLGLALVAGAFCFVFCDSAFRMVARVKARQLGPSDWMKLYVHDDGTGTLWHKTNVSTTISWRSTPSHTVSFNNLGCRGSLPVTAEKLPGTIRVLTLGGSTTEDVFVADDETWPERLRQRLQAVPGMPPVEVINLGCLGYGIKSSVTNLVARGLHLDPDIVIVYHRINDFLLGYPAKNPSIQVHHAFVDYENRPVGISKYFFKSIILDRLNRSAYYRDGRSAEFTRAYWRSDNKVSFDPEDVEEPIVSGLESLFRLSKQHQFQLIVGIQATLMKAEPLDAELPYLWEVLRWTYNGRFVAWQTMLDAMQRIHDAEVDFCQKHKLLCVDVESSVPKNTDFFIDHIHTTPRGSDRVAEVFVKELLATGAIARRSSTNQLPLTSRTAPHQRSDVHY